LIKILKRLLLRGKKPISALLIAYYLNLKKLNTLGKIHLDTSDPNLLRIQRFIKKYEGTYLGYMLGADSILVEDASSPDSEIKDYSRLVYAIIKYYVREFAGWSMLCTLFVFFTTILVPVIAFVPGLLLVPYTYLVLSFFLSGIALSLFMVQRKVEMGRRSMREVMMREVKKSKMEVIY